MPDADSKIDVGVLGATGTVGRRLVELLSAHPWFHLTEVGGSPESAGHRYGEVVLRQEWGDAFSEAGDLIVKESGEEWRASLLLSALPARVAGPVEAELAGRGHLVVSNASPHRMDPHVPLIIPEVNPDHLSLIEGQISRWSGALVTNPNCSAIGLAIALAPLHRQFGVRSAVVTTLQSISGAGRPGPGAADLVDNLIPYIAGEEAKLAREPRKILGEVVSGAVEPAPFSVSAITHRVPILHGHMLAVSVKLDETASLEAVTDSLTAFRGEIEDEGLPSAPARPLVVLQEEDRPQPRLDRDRGSGMLVMIGRPRRCEVLDIKFSVLVHNLIRGAAGAALLNAELCHARGLTARVRAA